MTLQLLFHNLATASDEGIAADCLAERKAEQQFVLNQVMGNDWAGGRLLLPGMEV